MHAVPPSEGKRPRKHRLYLWRAVELILVGLGLGYVLWTEWPHQAKPINAPSPLSLAAMPDSAEPLKPGPWGNLEVLPIFIEPPDEYLPMEGIENADHRWQFTGFSTEQLLNLFNSADLTSVQRAELTDTSKWKSSPQAIYVSPSKELLLSLSPKARKQIYEPMLNDPNSFYRHIYQYYPADRFDSYFENSGVSSDTIALVKKLSFSHGKLLFFCDIPLVLDTLNTAEEKHRLLKTLFRKSTLLLRLHITPDSDVGELEHYWIRAGWGLDLRPMLESLARLPRGARIDVVELLPPVPSADIYTYPFPSLKPEDARKDCEWTSLNFFRDVPDDRFTDINVVRQTLLTDYYPVMSDPRYGDILALSKPNGEIIHLAVYIAADVYYTKNSGNFHDPFILTTQKDLIDHFSAQIPEDQTLTATFYRNKYY